MCKLGLSRVTRLHVLYEPAGSWHEGRYERRPLSVQATFNPSHFSLCVPRKHLAHCCLAGMVVSGNADKYKKLRTAYNSVLDDSGLRAPPFEEYRGMSSICGNVMCKWVLRVGCM